MKLEKEELSFFEDEWVSYEETKLYQNFKERQAERHKEEVSNKLNMEIHNQLSLNKRKTTNIIFSYLRAVLDKTSTKKGWKIEVWLEESKSKKALEFTCGISLVRPNKSTVYVRKAAGSVNKVVKKSFCILEKIITSKEKRWKQRQRLYA